MFADCMSNPNTLTQSSFDLDESHHIDGPRNFQSSYNIGLRVHLAKPIHCDIVNWWNFFTYFFFNLLISGQTLAGYKTFHWETFDFKNILVNATKIIISKTWAFQVTFIPNKCISYIPSCFKKTLRKLKLHKQGPFRRFNKNELRKWNIFESIKS